MPPKPDYTSYSSSIDGSEMTPDELEFLFAMYAFKKRNRRLFPSWREILYVAHCLGYRKVAEPVPIDKPQPCEESTKSEIRNPK
jgi:hypothetical protein